MKRNRGKEKKEDGKENNFLKKQTMLRKQEIEVSSSTSGDINSQESASAALSNADESGKEGSKSPKRHNPSTSKAGTAVDFNEHGDGGRHWNRFGSLDAAKFIIPSTVPATPTAYHSAASTSWMLQRLGDRLAANMQEGVFILK